MIRYVCKNPYCLNTFLSPDLDIFKRCELCDDTFIHVGNPERSNSDSYPPVETLEELKIKYIKMRDKALREGLTEDECLTVGRAVRKIRLPMRKKLLRESGLWKEGIVYKYIMKKNGLLKMVEDKRATRKIKNDQKKINRRSN